MTPIAPDHEDLVERAEAICKDAEAAVLADEPGARSALGLAMFLKNVAVARRILNGSGVKTSAHDVELEVAASFA